MKCLFLTSVFCLTIISCKSRGHRDSSIKSEAIAEAFQEKPDFEPRMRLMLTQCRDTKGPVNNKRQPISKMTRYEVDLEYKKSYFSHVSYGAGESCRGSLLAGTHPIEGSIHPLVNGRVDLEGGFEWIVKKSESGEKYYEISIAYMDDEKLDFVGEWRDYGYKICMRHDYSAKFECS